MMNFALANVLKYLIRENNIYINYNKIEQSEQGIYMHGPWGSDSKLQLPINISSYLAIKDSVSIPNVVIQYDDILKAGF